jgi:hypothetical protein
LQALTRAEQVEAARRRFWQAYQRALTRPVRPGVWYSPEDDLLVLDSGLELEELDPKLVAELTRLRTAAQKAAATGFS